MEIHVRHNFTMGDFEDKVWFTPTMFIIGGITTPINFFGIYIILSQAKIQMSGYRYHLLIYQTWSTTADILMNYAVAPVIFSPLPVGHTSGFLSNVFHIKEWIQVIIVFSMMCGTYGAIEELFLYRYQQILPAGHRYKLSHSNFLLLVISSYIIWITIVGGSSYVASPDQTIAISKLIDRYPQLKDLTNIPNFFAFDIDSGFILLIFLFSCVIKIIYTMSIAGLFVVLSHRALDKLIMSNKTKLMHIRLIYTLCIQAAIPSVVFAIPCLSVVVPIAFGIPHTYISCLISSIILSTHTFFGTISLLMLNKPYRALISSSINLIKKKLGGKLLIQREINDVSTGLRKPNDQISNSRNI